MKLLAWNIKWGGQQRCARIKECIAAHDADVIVLTEYVAKVSAPLIEQLSGNWPHVALTEPAPRQGGVAILSRLALEVDALPRRMSRFAPRYLPVTIADARLSLRGIYGPLEQPGFDSYWRAALTTLGENARSGRDVIAIGDFNTGAAGLDSTSVGVLKSPHYGRLSKRGYVDLWRHAHGDDAREYSWLGRAHPYRLDHAFGTVGVVRRLTSCAYSHAEREAGVSDHSVMVVEVGEA